MNTAYQTITETPLGVIDGINKIYTISMVPDNFLGLYLNEAWVDPARYTRSGKVITFVAAIDASLAGLSFNAQYLVAVIPSGAIVNTGNYITNAEFQSLNPLLDLSQFGDTTISGLITVASAEIDAYLQYSLWAENIVNEQNEAMVDTRGNLVVYPLKFPVNSVSSLSVKLGSYETVLNLTDGNGKARYDLPSRGKSIVYPFQELSTTGTFSIRNLYQIREQMLYTRLSYNAGYAAIPSDVKLACSLLARDMVVRETSNPTGATSASQGGISLSWAPLTGGDNDGASPMVNQAQALLASYRKMWS